ncbi:hypothetical protein KC19_2G074000 [Ceratodon purpureus]|uniref:GDSL esterase/lipase n=1 Tax=Ceratodon purpureus TaxID=3225 RepID=A0A8T0IT96_CERPU|nr:hypothetical protein KC19_2G074000 [Ceratodon purpureus]KAG0586230.1 hypothetical protein KC19_2G074000 [Ceratodon purpureus]KAG0586231.1 hypothetical protein KC19_2G074000 [Ceratodon purpureus]KAG0586232.1 hypothetical protein KC19_2G074000 [Ceratodon purpureus]
MEPQWSGQRRLVSAVWCALFLLPWVAMAQKVPAVFIFGDSLSDPGNNNYIHPTLSRANTLPNGIDFPEGPMATGRYTNGRTTVDIIGQLAGFKEFIPPYLAPNTTGPMILKGVSYASGAGGILDSSGYILVGRLSMNKQLEYFANTKAQIMGMIGETAGMELISKALYSINMGSNDYVNNYYQPLSPIANLTRTQVANLLVSTYKGQLTTLYNMGARKMVVAAVGPLGCIPFQLAFRFSKNGECSEKANADVREANAGILAMVKQLNAELPGSQFVFADAYKGVSDLIANPGLADLKVVNMGCCGALGRFKGVIPCVQILSPCTDRFEYLFWDPYHPTDKANVWLSNKFWQGAEYTYPMTVQQLVELQM